MKTAHKQRDGVTITEKSGFKAEVDRDAAQKVSIKVRADECAD